MRKRNLWLGVGLALLVPVIVAASNLTIPNTFTPNTPIKSADVNANFQAVQTAVNSKLDVTASPLVAGTRLQVLGLRATDGTQSFVGNPSGFGTGYFFDKTVGVNCAPALATDGTLRCLPPYMPSVSGGPSNFGFYTDPSCMNPLYGPQTPNPPGWPAQTTYYGTISVSVADGGSALEAHAPTLYTGTKYTYQFVTFDGGGQNFVCVVASPAPVGYQLGPVVAPFNFAQFTPVAL